MAGEAQQIAEAFKKKAEDEQAAIAPVAPAPEPEVAPAPAQPELTPLLDGFFTRTDTGEAVFLKDGEVFKLDDLERGEDDPGKLLFNLMGRMSEFDHKLDAIEKALTAPKIIVRDASGKAIGVKTK